jgi:hypothetical protein
MTPASRGFFGRRRPSVDDPRLPPGQYWTDDFPVLSAGPTPRTATEDWSFTVRGQRRGARDVDLGRAERAPP